MNYEDLDLASKSAPSSKFCIIDRVIFLHMLLTNLEGNVLKLYPSNQGSLAEA